MTAAFTSFTQCMKVASYRTESNDGFQRCSGTVAPGLFIIMEFVISKVTSQLPKRVAPIYSKEHDAIGRYDSFFSVFAIKFHSSHFTNVKEQK